MKSRKRQILILGAVLLGLILAFALIFTATGTLRSTGSDGNKKIEITVTKDDEKTEKFDISTTEKFLGACLLEKGLISGEVGQFGLFVDTVDGVKADETKQQWWCFTKGGEEMTTGVDQAAIADGDKFEITLKTGW